MKKIYFFLLILLTSIELCAIEHGSTAHYYVGELGEKWQFPSDHLPVGLSVGDIHLALWNTLNTRYLYHIHANHQGLKGSLITTANIPEDAHSKLTMREEAVIDLVLGMVHHAVFPRSLIALQEVGNEVYEELRNRLPEKMAFVTAFPDDLANGDIFIYDTDRFDEISLVSGCFQICPRNTYLTLTLKEKKTGEIYRFMQSHVPGGPVASGSARKEWAEDLLINFDPNAVNIVMGDMNRSPDFFLKDLKDAAEDFELEKHPFQNLWVPYPTHIDTYKRATWIDNFFIYQPRWFPSVSVEKDPENLGPDVEKAVSILRGFCSCPLRAALELRSQLAVHQFAVFQGSFESWTDVQLKAALPDILYVKCNLHQLFCIQEGEKEKEWIRENKRRLIADWSEEECIVIDQFDFASALEDSEDQLETVMEVIDMARTLRRQGKSVVLVTHQNCRSAFKFWEILSDALSFHPSNIIVQEYLTDEEEERLLSNSELNREEKDLFKALTKGSPFAYAALADQKESKMSFNELCDGMMHHIEYAWSEFAGNESFDVQSILVEIAHQSLEIDLLAETSEFGYLLETGFIGSKNGTWIMPQVIRNFLLTINP